MKPDSYQIIKGICGDCIYQTNKGMGFLCKKHDFKIEVAGHCNDWKRVKMKLKNINFEEIEKHLKNGGSLKLNDGTEINSYCALKKWGKEKGLDLD